MASPDRTHTSIRTRTLNAILEHGLPALERRLPASPDPGLDSLAAVRRTDLGWGDALLVTTKNSTYAINRAGQDTWFVWGGWFTRQGRIPAVVGINGCTWGGSVIYAEVLAAPGLFLEFANGVTTTRIRSVRILRAAPSR